MDKLLEAVTDMVCIVSPEKVKSLANKLRAAGALGSAASLTDVVATPAALAALSQLISAWRETNVDAEQLALMLQAAEHAHGRVAKEQVTELVWTGPKTPFVSPRQTEQALLQVINAARSQLYLTSFVAYRVPQVVEALCAANYRGVVVRMMFELSDDHGGSVSHDSISLVSKTLPFAELYAWHHQSPQFFGGRLHAKIAVADGAICFITSANLTNWAMSKNMEAGVLISGGHVPEGLAKHLQALIDTGVVSTAFAL